MSRISRIAIEPSPHLSPAPELAQHHDTLPPFVDGRTRRDAHQVVTRLERLVDATGTREGPDWITPDVFTAAAKWREWHDTAQGVSDHGAWGVRTSRSSDGGLCALDHQVHALAQLRAVQEAIGKGPARLIEWCVAMDFSWIAVGRLCQHITAGRRPVSDKTARAWTVLALRALADWYERTHRVDRARERATRIRAASSE